jgi:thioredoxin-like negative regulator of GroEL
MAYLGAIVAVVVGLMVVMQLAVHLRARALRGKPLPKLAADWAKKLSGRSASILYFFSPGCAACKPLTPRFQEMSKHRPGSVFLVNVAEDLSLAQALSVMATPSVVEVANGIIVNYFVGPPPADLMARYA